MEEHDLMQKNINAMTSADVILASYLGSGSSLLGGILIELGIDYVEGYQEEIISSHDQTVVSIPYWREHWPQLLNKYKNNKVSTHALKAVKSHYYPSAFSESGVQKAVLLVRDARDAVISYYNWRCGFSDETGTLNDFLSREGFTGRRPFDDWTDFNEEWLSWGKENKIHVIRYEDIKLDPLNTIKALLSFLDHECDAQSIIKAIENSSFSKISKEEKSATGKKIFRKGLIGEWRETLSKNDLSLISQKTFSMLAFLQYTDETVLDHALCLIGADHRRQDIISSLKNQGQYPIVLFGGERYEGKNIYWLDRFESKHLECYISGPVVLFDRNPDLLKCVSFFCRHKGLPCIEADTLNKDEIIRLMGVKI